MKAPNPSTPSIDSWPSWLDPAPAVAARRNLARSTYGGAVGKLAAAAGVPLMPWQQYCVDVGLEVDDDGRFVYQLVVCTVPRQSGKTTLFGAVLDHRALIVPRARAWFTMQTQKDAVDWLTNEHWPLLAPFANNVALRRMAGSEHIRWNASAGLVRPFPPNPTGLHGKVSDLVVVDECWSFDLMKGQQLDQAIVPTQATRPNAQVWKVSTAGDATSTWWLGTVEAGRAAVKAGRDSGVAYFEWSCPEALDPTDPESWPLYHPAYERTIGPSSMAAALAMLGPDEFSRAYGNVWTSTVSRVIPLPAWRAAADPDAEVPEPGRLALAFDVAVDRSDAAVVAAWRDDAGVGHLEVADYRPGVGWLAERIPELVGQWQPRAVFYDAAGPAMDVADVLTRGGLELVGLKAREYAAACAGLLEALVSDPPAVRVLPHPALDSAASAAARRALGDSWAWGRRQSTVSISSLAPRPWRSGPGTMLRPIWGVPCLLRVAHSLRALVIASDPMTMVAGPSAIGRSVLGRDGSILPPPAGWGGPGAYVYDAQSARRIPSVGRAIQLYGGLVKQMPMDAYRGFSQLSPTPRICQQPDPDRGGAWFVQVSVEDYLLNGNAIAYVSAIGADGWPLAAVWLPASWVYVVWDSYSDETDVRYTYLGTELDPSRVIHVRRGADRNDPVRGVGVVEEHLSSLDRIAMEEEYERGALANGAVPSMAVTVPQATITQEVADEAKADWLTKFSGPVREPVFLPNGTTVVPLAWSPTDTQLAQARQASLLDIANMFNLDGYWLGAPVAGMTYRTAGPQYQQILRTSLEPVLSDFEDVWSSAWLPRGSGVRFRRSQLLRDDLATSTAAAVAAFNAKIVSLPEARAMLGLPPDVAGAIGGASDVPAVADPEDPNAAVPDSGQPGGEEVVP